MNEKVFRRTLIVLLVALVSLLSYVAWRGATALVKRTTVGPGYIRSVEIHSDTSFFASPDEKVADIAFEGDSGSIRQFTFEFDNGRMPPVWEGMHCTMNLKFLGDDRWMLERVERVGPDAKEK